MVSSTYMSEGNYFYASFFVQKNSPFFFEAVNHKTFLTQVVEQGRHLIKIV